VSRFVLVVGVVSVLVTSACGGDGTPNDAKAPPPADQQVLAQYRLLWQRALPAAAQAPSGQRRDILAAVMTGGALGRAVGAYATLDKRHQKAYGADLPLHENVVVRGTTAVVTGCLDSSKGGVADKKTGRKLTKGLNRNPTTVTFTRGSDGVWRVLDSSFPGTKGC
jgi:hypothetical protein